MPNFLNLLKRLLLGVVRSSLMYGESMDYDGRGGWAQVIQHPLQSPRWCRGIRIGKIPSPNNPGRSLEGISEQAFVC